MQTIWKAIPGYEGSYEVSNNGDVRSVDRVINFKDGRTRTYKGKVIKPFIDSDGYVIAQLSVNRKPTRLRVHRAVMNAFVGPCPDGEVVRHLNSNPQDNRLSNLSYGTANQNMHDMMLAGNGNTQKLVPCDVNLVRLLSGFGWSQQFIADVVGVSVCTIDHINHGRTWGWLEVKD